MEHYGVKVKRSNRRDYRGFSELILEKFDQNAKKLDEEVYSKFRLKVEALIDEFQQLRKDEKVKRSKLNKLKGFTEQELKDYLNTLKK